MYSTMFINRSVFICVISASNSSIIESYLVRHRDISQVCHTIMSTYQKFILILVFITMYVHEGMNQFGMYDW